jgi:RNA polymerase sigma factor (TIGR02999 family)
MGQDDPNAEDAGARSPAQGNAGAPLTDALISQVYEQLRRLARQYMSRERPGLTLQATALVHEAYARIIGASPADWQSQAHFFHAAAEAMRRILIERGRQRKQLKRGGGTETPRARIPLNAVDLAVEVDADEILALDEALSRLEKEEPDVAKVVRLRFFAGLSVEETAQVLGISPRSVNREWTYARAWLFRQLGHDGE